MMEIYEDYRSKELTEHYNEKKKSSEFEYKNGEFEYKNGEAEQDHRKNEDLVVATTVALMAAIL